jgi:putative ATP-binding cassette transporter
MSKIADFTTAARRTWALAVPYFRSEDRWKARGLLVAVIALKLAAVYFLVLLNEWTRTFYDVLEKRDAGSFASQIWRWTWIVAAFLAVAVYKFYLTQLLELRWRAWMTSHYLTRWLASHAFYRMELARYASTNAPPDNPDQRIQEDLNLFTSYTISLSMGMLNSLVTLVSFVGILWTVSGDFDFTIGGERYYIGGYMVWVALGYSIAGSIATHYIGRPQIRLNFEQQRLEADFRHHLVRVREYSEAIALDRGEAVEREHLGSRFSRVLANSLELIKKQKNLIWFSVFFSQTASIFPTIVAAPRLFAGAIQLGELIQIGNAFGQVQGALSWFVDNYTSFATWRATTDRLTAFEDSMRSSAAQPLHEREEGARLSTQGLALALPNGQPLLDDVNVNIAPGENVLVQGPSGSGKSTLLRAFSGIWPFARGRVEVPRDAMTIPQNPYFPDGSLRAALAYPEPASTYTDDQLKQALEHALLPQLASRLDEEDAWTQKLSGGERQRLALARVFLKQPSWVFADEATSALDAPAQRTLYERLAALVKHKGGSLVSIAHGPSLDDFHAKRWELAPQGAGHRIVVK